MGESLVLPLELFYHSLLHIWLVGGVAIHLANSTSCKSSLMGVLRVANLVNCTHCPEAELCFYTGGRGCLTIVYTSYHMIYTQIWLAKMREKQLILFYWSFKINYACFSNVRILGYCNLYHATGADQRVSYWLVVLPCLAGILKDAYIVVHVRIDCGI